MIRLWRFLLAYAGDKNYVIPFITAVYCGYNLARQKEKDGNNE